jgi:GxxExxY protein
MQTMRRGVLVPLAARLSSQGRAIVMPAERRKVRRVFIRGKRSLGPKKTKRDRKNGVAFGFLALFCFCLNSTSLSTRIKSRVFELCDIVRETAFAIHRYHGPGHVEKIYENALVNRLRKQGLMVEQQLPIKVYDEDGTLLGDLVADALVEGVLLLELKAVRTVLNEHVAQLLGYLKSSRIKHGALLNFGAGRFYIKMYAMSQELHEAE